MTVRDSMQEQIGEEVVPHSRRASHMSEQSRRAIEQARLERQPLNKIVRQKVAWDM